ncbi:SH3 domain-containing protein [Aquimarina algicola]|uniref:SH3 domain-containing protein n=1 Tax=Aquimarina algicola TaxID=2589995 RepID=A0A504JGF5_9FLAO|nr:SH3 domain-containing protein [Aquimarina algicola]TPN85869.1 SH3 domain-containing protein [Aquimarina algicola]
MTIQKYITLLSVIIILVSCKQNQKKPVPVTDNDIVEEKEIIEKNKTPIRSKTDTLYYVYANGLTFREQPSLTAKKISTLKYLEPVYLLKNHPDKQETISDEGNTIIGNWVYVRLLNGKKGYLFNGFLRTVNELDSLPPKGMLAEELLINGKLNIKSTKEEFINVLGKPDSIKSFIVVEDDDLVGEKNEYYYEDIYYIEENVAEYFGTEEGDLMWYDSPETQLFYKNGVAYEELNNEISFLSINFMSDENNFLDYDGFRIDSQTTKQEIITIFPITTKENKWCYENKEEFCSFDFGFMRTKDTGSEISWNLSFTNQKATTFSFYYYD